MTAALNRQIHPARLPENMPELQTRLANRRVVHDGQEARGIRHHGPVKQGFVVIQQIDQIDVAREVIWLTRQLHHHALQLGILCFSHIRNQPDQPERLLFLLGECRRFIQDGILEQIKPPLSCVHASPLQIQIVE